MMLDTFNKMLSEKCLLRGDERVLLAVSGGVDSMVMAHLFRAAGIAHGIAHCNFQLRGEASGLDEKLVRAYAQSHDVSFYSVAFSTQTIAESEKESIQVTARRLRYDWLEKIRREEGYDLIATAHHLNDAAETMLYNLSKGCGIRGLHGIAERRDRLVRPLLFATRKEIEDYAHAEGITWREDASNLESYYARNKIRREVIPALKEINPQWEQTMQANIERFRHTEALFQYAIESIGRHVRKEKPDGSISILLSELSAFPAPATVLYELIRPFGFVPAQASNILDRLDRQAGAVFLAPGYRLLVDRSEARIEPIRTAHDAPIELHPNMGSIILPEGWLEMDFIQGSPVVIPAEPNTAMLDAGLLAWPMQLRRWQAGDFFYPFGMKGRSKKLQDFFSDEKLSRFEKEKVWILETAKGEICWVAGYRIDDRFRISAHTKQYLALNYHKKDSTL